MERRDALVCTFCLRDHVGTLLAAYVSLNILQEPYSLFLAKDIVRCLRMVSNSCIYPIAQGEYRIALEVFYPVTKHRHCVPAGLRIFEGAEEPFQYLALSL